MRKQRFIYVPPVPSMRERDYQLAYLALCGDEEAWNALYQDSFAFVINAVKQLDDQHMFSYDDYYDMTDEAFGRCYEQLDRYQGLSRFRRWVLGYAKNIMYNRRRAQSTALRNQYLLECAAECQFRGSDPLYILIYLERAQYLWNAFFGLEKAEQYVIFQTVFFHTPPRTLAKNLLLTRKQVLQLYSEACLKLRWNYVRQYRPSALKMSF